MTGYGMARRGRLAVDVFDLPRTKPDASLSLVNPVFQQAQSFGQRHNFDRASANTGRILISVTSKNPSSLLVFDIPLSCLPNEFVLIMDDQARQ